MPFVLGLLAVVAVISSILLMLVVLLQEPKGGGLAAALGGSGMEAIGPATGGVNNFTAWVAGVWMVACFLHAILMTGGPAFNAAKPADAGNPPADTSGATQQTQPAGGGNATPPGGGGGNEKPK